MFDGLYKTYIYKVVYSATTEQSLPARAPMSVIEEQEHNTYMRIHIPCFPYGADYERLGVAEAGREMTRRTTVVARGRILGAGMSPPAFQVWLVSG